MKLRLKVADTARPGTPAREFEFQEGPVELGRSPTGHIVLEGSSVSRVHCVFDTVHGAWHVTHRGSSTPTLLGGSAIPGDRPTRLADGDRLVIASQEIVVELPREADAFPVPPSADPIPDLEPMRDSLIAGSDVSGPAAFRPLTSEPVAAPAAARPGPAGKVVPSLIGTAGPAIGVRFEVAELGRRYVVGRAPTCDLTIDDASVSRSHATLRFDGSRVYLREAGSRNPILVNGRPMVGEIPLSHGDSVAIGPATFQFVSEATTPAPSPPPAPPASPPDPGFEPTLDVRTHDPAPAPAPAFDVPEPPWAAAASSPAAAPPPPAPPWRPSAAPEPAAPSWDQMAQAGGGTTPPAGPATPAPQWDAAPAPRPQTRSSQPSQVSPAPAGPAPARDWTALSGASSAAAGGAAPAAPGTPAPQGRSREDIQNDAYVASSYAGVGYNAPVVSVQSPVEKVPAIGTPSWISYLPGTGIERPRGQGGVSLTPEDLMRGGGSGGGAGASPGGGAPAGGAAAGGASPADVKVVTRRVSSHKGWLVAGVVCMLTAVTLGVVFILVAL